MQRKLPPKGWSALLAAEPMRALQLLALASRAHLRVAHGLRLLQRRVHGDGSRPTAQRLEVASGVAVRLPGDALQLAAAEGRRHMSKEPGFTAAKLLACSTGMALWGGSAAACCSAGGRA